MYERVTLGVADREASERFYRTVLPQLGLEAGRDDDGTVTWSDFAIAPAAAPTRGLHLGFGAPSRIHVDAFWQAGVDNGYRSDGEPGPRPQYTPDCYSAFLLDPDGNSVEAVHHAGQRTDGAIDHLWIRVANVAAASAFYADVAARTGLRRRTNDPDHAQFVGATGSLSLVRGTRTEHAQLRFAATEPILAAVLRDPDGNTVTISP